MAKEIGLSKKEIDDLYLAAILHDVGKIAIPHDVLGKAGKLSYDERKIIRQHPVLSAFFIRALEYFEGLIPSVYFHHENFDGTGYPTGLSGKEIPIGARIIRVADAFDAITHDRVYQKRRSFKEAIHELKRFSGCDFDPDIVKIFIELVKRGKVKDDKE